MDARLSAADQRRLMAAAVLYLALVAPPVLALLESRLASHLAVLLPGLGAAGWLVGSALRGPAGAMNRKWNAAGIPGLLAAAFTVAFWMLPRALDDSLRDWAMEGAKLLTLPLLAGAPLGLSWPLLGPILRGVVKAQFVSMLGALGWLYSVAPVRLCASYLQSDQQTVGLICLVAAAVLAVNWSAPWFFASGQRLAPGRTAV
jgi:hypothetical protein